uniref:EOG090X04K8 n=1 Tax=Daphnia similis TaxID=35528 RepID=A0A4Y7N2W5_9CRUS|nr:EOG090X04K8 [Daphnia similis]SVE86694.1 EOG090X04K8 [Daphnia similis]SVE87321.1 EOG090X04K8 [Daphnia similis]
MRKRGELQAENGRSSLIEKGSNYQTKEMKEAPLIWSWKGEGKNIALLFFLYLLQGIPLGLTASIPLMLQNRHVSYKEQAEFSLVFWPFSLKLLWAPIVDSLYSSKMGRRKTWLVPVQYLIGIAMLFLSTRVDQYLDSEGSPNIQLLTIAFFTLNFLAATQDIAVDGWALTMLHRSNVGYASTCNSVGQTAGYFLGYVVFVAFESADFCNKYLRSQPEPYGLLTLSGFLYFWGIIFFITTTLVWFFKREKTQAQENNERDGHDGDEQDLSIMETYKLLLKIFKLPVIRWTVVVLLTCKIGFSASDAVSGLKLVEMGVPKAQLALLAVPLVPLQIVLPLFISRYTAGPRPMQVFINAIPYRLMFGFVYAGLVWITPWFQSSDNQFPFYYYLIVVIIYAIHQVTVYSMFVAVMAFFAKVSDPQVGGTYMTLLNTVCNLGGNWPSTLALWSVDALTWKSCHSGNSILDETNKCRNSAETLLCTEAGGKCFVDLDGFYVESFICIVFGFLWLRWGRRVIQQLQSKDESAWKVRNNL